jgi:hypothetical protein
MVLFTMSSKPTMIVTVEPILILTSHIFFFWWYWGLNSGLLLEPFHQPFFVTDFFRDRFSRTICLGWL